MSKAADFGFFLTRTFATTRNRKRSWPFIPGKYFVHDEQAPVAVTTLGSVDLAKEISDCAPAGLCIVGKVETENIGIEKIIKNILSNRAIRYLVLAGAEPPKHLTGATFTALFANGIDTDHNIPGSPGMRPLLPNTCSQEVEDFRNRITPVDMIGETDPQIISAKVAKLAGNAGAQGGAATESGFMEPVASNTLEHAQARVHDPKLIKLDKAGYFVINPEEGRLLVEHYDYKERLIRTIEGPHARDLYLTMIEEGWVSRLDHAAYLGKELARAEASLNDGNEFVQDGA
jgi:tetrahydromethanopterin S-methyltransferase subunit A